MFDWDTSLSHNACKQCFRELEPGRIPYLVEATGTTCCFCGSLNQDGIFLRRSPDETLCGGSCHGCGHWGPNSPQTDVGTFMGKMGNWHDYHDYRTPGHSSSYTWPASHRGITGYSWSALAIDYPLCPSS